LIERKEAVMKRMLFLPVAALAVALGAVGVLPQSARAEESVADFKKDCDTDSVIVEGLDPVTHEISSVSCKQGGKWATCNTDKNATSVENKPPEYTDQCSVIEISGSSGRTDPSMRPSPGSRMPGLGLPLPSQPARPLRGQFPRPIVR
jgi:hypothetical protein